MRLIHRKKFIFLEYISICFFTGSIRVWPPLLHRRSQNFTIIDLEKHRANLHLEPRDYQVDYVKSY